MKRNFTAIVLLIFAVSLAGLGYYRHAHAQVKALARAISCSPVCGSCAVSIAGTWRYIILKSNGDSNMYEITLSQSKGRVSGMNNTHTWAGTVNGNALDVSLAVSGEEVEGWVLHADAHIMNGSKIFGVFHDSTGATGSLTASKLP